MKSRAVYFATCSFFIVGSCVSLYADEAYELVFSTYFGGSSWEHARDVCVDNQGNVYMVGGTASADFPTTPGAYDRTFHSGGRALGAAGQCDAFVVKFDASGKLLWSTLLGGPNYDRAYGVEIDKVGNVVIAGRAGPGFPVTAGAFQTEYGGSGYNNFYGSQNGFVAKLSADGRKLIWSSYVGVGELCRDVDVDAEGNIYVPLGWNTRSAAVAQPKWLEPALARAFQKQPAGDNDCGVVKIKGDGTAVIWATWLGGSGRDSQEASIRVDAKQRVVLCFNTQSRDMPTTPGAASGRLNGPSDGYAAMLKADGSGLVYGTYLGGSGEDWAISTHNLAVDAAGNAYVAAGTASPDFPVTAGAFSHTRAGKNDIAIVKLSPTGALLQSTLVGGSGEENADGIYVDEDGSVFFAGETSSADFPTTPTAFQRTFGGKRDAVVVRLSPDFGRLLYATYMGGESYDNGRSACLGHDGSLYITGAADGPGWPTKNACQAGFAGGGGGWGNGDCLLARLRPDTHGKPSTPIDAHTPRR